MLAKTPLGRQMITVQTNFHFLGQTNLGSGGVTPGADTENHPWEVPLLNRIAIPYYPD